ncbi:MAG: prephenate dehydrogenase [Aggregatilineales bacterium]
MSGDTEGGFSRARVCIVGLGLMGGSLAMALHGKVGRITAQDINPAVIEAALAAGVIDAAGAPSDADIVVLAAPAHVILDLVPVLDVRPGTLVIDIASTKGRICDALDRLPPGVMAVGGHPMCGLAENGYRNATPGLYTGARFVLCETARTTGAARAQAEALVRAVGAQPVWLDRERHDYLTALTSHVPHLLSFALMRLAQSVDAEDPALFALAAGGFDGATRLARTDEAMIVGMFSTNAGHIREMARRLRVEMDRLEAALDDPEALSQVLGQIVEARRAYSELYGERPIA